MMDLVRRGWDAVARKNCGKLSNGTLNESLANDENVTAFDETKEGKGKKKKKKRLI